LLYIYICIYRRFKDAKKCIIVIKEAKIMFIFSFRNVNLKKGKLLIFNWFTTMLKIIVNNTHEKSSKVINNFIADFIASIW